MVVGVCLDILQYFGSADSVFDDKCVQIYLVRIFCRFWGPEERLEFSTKYRFWDIVSMRHY